MPCSLKEFRKGDAYTPPLPIPPPIPPFDLLETQILHFLMAHKERAYSLEELLSHVNHPLMVPIHRPIVELILLHLVWTMKAEASYVGTKYDTYFKAMI